MANAEPEPGCVLLQIVSMLNILGFGRDFGRRAGQYYVCRTMIPRKFEKEKATKKKSTNAYGELN